MICVALPAYNNYFEKHLRVYDCIEQKSSLIRERTNIMMYLKRNH